MKKKEKKEEDYYRSYEENLVRWQRRMVLLGSIFAAIYKIVEWLVEKLS